MGRAAELQSSGRALDNIPSAGTAPHRREHAALKAENKNGGDQLAPVLAVLCDLLLFRSALHSRDNNTATFFFQRFWMTSGSMLWIIRFLLIHAVGVGP